MALISWILYTEKAVGMNHPSLADVVNRPLRDFLIAVGIDPDSDITAASLPGGAVAWADVTGKPTTISGFGITDAYTNTQVDTLLAAKAALASPALTGNPTAPTQAALDNSTKIATTAYVDAAVAAGAGAGGTDLRDEVRVFRNAATTTGTIGLAAVTTAGTATAGTVANTNVLTRQQRIQYVGTTFSGSQCSLRTGSQTPFYPAAGFELYFVFAQESNINSGRGFIGLTTSTNLLTVDPSSVVDTIGLGYDQADSSAGNWQFMRNDGAGTATKVDTGVARDATSLYMLKIVTVDGTSYDVELKNLSTGASVFSATYTTDLPTTTNGLRLFMGLINEVGTGGTAPKFDFINFRGFIGPAIP